MIDSNPEIENQKSEIKNQKSKILLVDDNEQNLYLLQVLLEGHGYEVVTAGNGIEALEKARRDPPDMIIADILMPVMDGFTLCRQWKADDQLKEIPFVFYTATYTDPKDEEFALSLGAERFIVKPVEPDVFVGIVRGVVAEHKAGRLVVTSGAPATREPEVLREYSERLVKKLEDKMVQLEQTNRRLTALYQASTGLASVKPLDELVPYALSTVVEAMGYANASYFAYDEARQEFRLLEAVGFSDEILGIFQRELVFGLGEERGLVGLVGQTREPLIVADTAGDPRWITLDETIRSALFVPVVHEGRLLGVANFLSVEAGAFNDEDARSVMTLANNVAVALENARLFEEVVAQNTHLRQLNQAIEQAAEAVVITDLRGEIEYVNPAFERITGYSRDEALGQNPRILKSGKHDQAFYREMWETILSGEVWHGSLTNRKKSGELYHEGMTIAPVLDKSGDVVNFVAIKRDVTEQVQAAEALLRVNRALEVLSECNRAMMHATEESSLLHKICQIVVDIGGYRLAWVGFAEQDDEKTVRPVAQAGYEEAYLDTVKITWADTELGRGPTGTAIRTGAPGIARHILTDASFEPWRLEATTRGYMSSIALPLISNGQTLGALNIYAVEPDAFDTDEVNLLTKLAGNLAYGIVALRTRAARVRAEKALQRQLEELTVLNAVAIAGVEAASEDALIDRATQIIGERLYPDNFGVLLLDEAAGVLRVHPSYRGVRAEVREITLPLGYGIAGTVAARGQPWRLPDVTREPRYLDVNPDMCSELCVPLKVGERVIGVINAESAQLDAFAEADEQLLTTIAGQLATAIEKVRLFEQTREWAAELAALAEVSSALRVAHNAEEIMEIVLTRSLAVLDARHGALAVPGPEPGTLVIVQQQGWPTSMHEHIYRHDSSIFGHVFHTGQPYLTTDVAADPMVDQASRAAWAAVGAEARSAIYAALRAEEEIIGIIAISMPAPRVFSTDDLRLLTAIAEMAGNAIRRASLHEETQRQAASLALAYDATLEGWSRAMDLRDRETEGHTRRVTELTLRLARAMGMSEAELLHVRRGALLHDIGKMGIPDRILHKPGSLAEVEWEIMRRHPVYAHEMLAPIAYLRPALDIPYCHHERWDGSGYPRGLRGEEIPMAARIFAVVDVWDALRSDRPYRQAWPEEKAREHLREQAEKHFDPRVVRAFLELLPERGSHE